MQQYVPARHRSTILVVFWIGCLLYPKSWTARWNNLGAPLSRQNLKRYSRDWEEIGISTFSDSLDSKQVFGSFSNRTQQVHSHSVFDVIIDGDTNIVGHTHTASLLAYCTVRVKDTLLGCIPYSVLVDRGELTCLPWWIDLLHGRWQTKIGQAEVR
jgi:hypothetical protein